MFAGVEARGPQQVSSSVTFRIAVVVVVILRQNLSLSLGLAVWARVTSQLHCLVCPSLSSALQSQVHATPVGFSHVFWGSKPRSS